MTDYELGIERAAHEVEWMKRGYVAWLLDSVQAVADAIRTTLPRDTYEQSYRDALKRATKVAVQMRETSRDVHLIAVYDEIANRLDDLPDDPLDEHHCRRKDGQLPTTSRGYMGDPI